mmetsp:Transcript_18683/g.35047  ORF Transcript_18683/g.35047 Transcript_18683/m.35047 type:complete len:169 (-) Transcript_18683:94-600(-)
MAGRRERCRLAGVLLLVAFAATPLFVGPSQSVRPVRAESRLIRQATAGARDDGEGAAVGAAGIGASLIMAWSEWTLKSTGCGLPAGPFGLLGAAEGLSYLAVLGLVGFNIYARTQPGPRNWSAALEAASALALVVTFAGAVVLYFQIQDYGFVPEAVPTEGGRCSNIG